jgi:hypothetical protein
VAAVVGAIRAECARIGRAIPEDHYGASLAFRFGDPGDAAVDAFAGPRTANRSAAELARERGRYALGSARDILERLAEYRRAGATKFVLIPVASSDDDVIDQTRRLAEEVIPIAHGWA